MSYQKILVAIDQSSRADTVFHKALDIAKKDGAELFIFHCINVQQSAEMAPLVETGVGINLAAGRTALQVQQEMLEKEEQRVSEVLQSYHQKATNEGVTAQFDRKVGDPGTWICNMTRSWGADLVVLGRRGRRGWTEILLGSVSNHVVHNAPCSVLVVQGEPDPSER